MTFTPNQIHRDEYGRPSGILLIDKPLGLTSHDVVYKARKALGTKNIGHAGALDPLASGVLVILVGKATKLTESLINHDKEYLAEILIGISTDSADREGNLVNVEFIEQIPDIEPVLSKFTPSYRQFVPVFSSVKVDGEKLRVLGRKYPDYRLVNEADRRMMLYTDNQGVEHTVNIPAVNCRIDEIVCVTSAMMDISEQDFYTKHQERLQNNTKFPLYSIRVACSKGTYIRSLAEDIGLNLEPALPSMLWGLRRTKVGDYTIDNVLSLEQLESYQ